MQGPLFGPSLWIIALSELYRTANFSKDPNTSRKSRPWDLWRSQTKWFSGLCSKLFIKIKMFIISIFSHHNVLNIEQYLRYLGCYVSHNCFMHWFSKYKRSDSGNRSEIFPNCRRYWMHRCLKFSLWNTTVRIQLMSELLRHNNKYDRLDFIEEDRNVFPLLL